MYRLLVLFMAMVFIIPTGILADSLNNNEASEEEKLLIKYISMDENNIPVFDKEAAVKDGVDKEIVEAGEVFQQIVNQEMDNNDDGVQPFARIPIWGNWCGPEYGSGVPIDILDSICRTHDLCYGSRGYHKCSCDEDMQASIRRDINKMTGGQKVAANGMLAWLWVKVNNRNSTGGILSCKW